jgi:prepilin-type N-terminal cleavage/methylation domain-containing protein
VQFQQQPRAINKKQFQKGLTVIEVLVAIALLGAVVLLAQGFVIPLQLTQRSSLESSSLNYAKSYIELIKVNWLQASLYGLDVATVNADSTFKYWPKWGTTGTVDIKLPTGWTIAAVATSANTSSVNDAKFNAVALKTLKDTLRLVTVTVTPPTASGAKPIVLTTLIARPSTGVTI